MDTSQTRYRQCKLSHPASKRFQVAWIPNIYAKKNWHLEISGEDGWRVDEVYTGTLRQMVDFEGQRHAQKHFQGSSQKQ